MKTRARSVALVVAAVVLLVGALGLALWPTAKRGAFSEILSTHRADSLGAKALFEVLARAGRTPKRHTEDLGALPAGGVLFLLNPEAPRPLLPSLPRGPTFSPSERRAARRFVEAGGRFVVVSNRTTALHRDFELRVVDEPVDEQSRAGARKARTKTEAGELLGSLGLRTSAAPAPARAAPSGPGAIPRAQHARGLARQLFARRIHHFDVPAHDARTTFFHDGRAVVVTLRRGRGEAVFVASPSLAGNALLAQADNLAFWSDLAAPPTDSPSNNVRFDEYHHGHRTPRGLVALAVATDLHYVLWQLAVVAGLLVWSGLRRLSGGRASRPSGDPKKPGATEGLLAMASLYERGRLGRHAADRIFEAIEHALAVRLQLRGERPDDLAAVLRRRGRPELADVFSALAVRRAALAERPRARELLAFARAAAALRRAVDASFSVATRSRLETAQEPRR